METPADGSQVGLIVENGPGGHALAAIEQLEGGGAVLAELARAVEHDLATPDHAPAEQTRRKAVKTPAWSAISRTDELAKFGYGESDVLARSVDDRFVALMRFQIERIRALYAQAEPSIAMLSPESRYTVRLALSLYRRILERIERNGYDVYSRRAFVPLGSKLATALAIAVAR